MTLGTGSVLCRPCFISRMRAMTRPAGEAPHLDALFEVRDPLPAEECPDCDRPAEKMVRVVRWKMTPLPARKRPRRVRRR